MTTKRQWTVTEAAADWLREYSVEADDLTAACSHAEWMIDSDAAVVTPDALDYDGPFALLLVVRSADGKEQAISAWDAPGEGNNRWRPSERVMTGDHSRIPDLRITGQPTPHTRAKTYTVSMREWTTDDLFHDRRGLLLELPDDALTREVCRENAGPLDERCLSDGPSFVDLYLTVCRRFAKERADSRAWDEAVRAGC